MFRFTVTSSLLLTFALAGCQSPLDDSLYSQWENDRQTTVGQIISRQQQQDTVTPDALPEPATLDQLIAYAQKHNPMIQAASFRIEQAEHGIILAKSLDDPMLTISPVGNMAQTADGEVTAMASISQRFPISGRLTTQSDAAKEQIKIATQQRRQTQLALTRDVKQAYWNLQLANQSLTVYESQKQLMHQVHESADASYRAGRAAQQDLLRLNVEISALDNRIIATQQQRNSAIARINSLLNRPADAPLTLADVVASPVNLQSADTWQKQALNHSPQLKQIHHAIAQARKQLKLAHLKRIPDLTVMLNYAAVADHGTSMAANGDDQLYAGIGINLPIWQEKLEAGEKLAIARIRELLSQLIAEHNQLQFAIADMYQRVEAQQKQDTLYRDTILPQAQQVLDSSRVQYRSGRGPFADLIDN
ncbi:MAG: TolC family protein [Phycisphaeraceae bacterium JB051]